MSKVLLSEAIHESGIRLLESKAEIVFCPEPTEEAIGNLISDVDALIIRTAGKVTRQMIKKAERLKVISRTGGGLNNVDIEAASRKGVVVLNAPTGNTLAATEHTLAMMLGAVRRLPFAHISLDHGEWDRKKFMGTQLYKKTLGVVGLGRIGSEVARRALSFDMSIIAYDPYIKREKAEKVGVELVENLSELLERSDIITFHVPLTEETTGMIGDGEFNGMKDRVVLVNCARGGVVEETALARALESGKVSMAAVDVFSKEPLPKDSPLHGVPNLIITPHLGANTEEAQKNVSVIIAQQVINVLKGLSYENAVNLPYVRGRLSPELQVYFDLAEKMGHFLSQFTTGRIEGVQVTLVGSLFAEDVSEKVFDSPFRYQPYTFAVLKGLMETYQQEAASYISAPYFAKERGISITEAKADRVKNYSDLISVKVITDKGENTVEGTVFADLRGRVTGVDKYRVDLVAEGTFLFFTNRDRPGVIGKVGTILGQNRINVAGFYLGRENYQGSAVGFVALDSRVPEGVLQEIKKLEEIIEAKEIVL